VRPKAADVRFYIDADVRGLGLIIGALRSDVTYPGDLGAEIHKRKRPPCPITTPDVLDTESRSWLMRKARSSGESHVRL